MSNLPHPLGSSNAGEIFYPGAPYITAYDVAGAHGSRAVEFGEDGVSSATNRLGYALAKNDEYQQARLETPIATPRYVSWTPTSGSGDRYVFSGVDLFVGDATYLPETQDTRDSLICVLDSNYNEILDVYGNRVVVKSIKNSGETSSIVGDPPSAGGDGNGFYSGGAVIRFKSVNPVSGVDYLPTVVIPDGTNVILVYGLAGTLDSLATSGLQYLMRDMLVKGTIRSATHIAAANFLRDGSRTMLANIDMDGHQVRNCQAVRGTGGSPLEIVNTLGSGERIMFSDANVSFATLSNTGCTTPYTPGGFWPSILGVLNSSAKLNEKLHGNRVIDKGGALDWQAGYLNIPDMVVALNGEAVNISAQRFPAVGTVSGGASYFLVVDYAGTLVERTPSTIISSDLLVAYYLTYGGGVWSSKADARWTFNGTTASFEITVAPSTYRGADFTSLQEAFDFVAAVSPSKPEGRFVIRVIGEIEIDSMIDLTTYGYNIHATVIGDNPLSSIIKTSTTFSAASHMFKISTGSVSIMNRVNFENLTLKWKSTNDQDAAYGMIYNPGSGTIIRNCLFTGATNKPRVGVLYAGSGTISTSLHMRDCYFNNISDILVEASARAYGIVIDNCLAENCSSTNRAFRLMSEGNRILHTTIIGDVTTHFDHGAWIGNLGEISNCKFYTHSGNTITLVNPSTGTLQLDVYGNQFVLGTGTGTCLYMGNSTGQNCRISFLNNTVVGGARAIHFNNGSLHTGMTSIVNNRFDGQATQAIYGQAYARELHILGNHFLNQGGDVIDLVDGYDAVIDKNKIVGFGSGVSNFALRLDETSPSTAIAKVTNNYFGCAGAHTSARIFYSGIEKVICVGNRFEGYNGSAYIYTQAEITSYNGCQFSDNDFEHVGSYCLRFIDPEAINTGFVRINNNRFGYVGVGGASITLTGLSGVSITNNIFGSGGDIPGVAIEAFSGTTDVVKSLVISNNNFFKVQGRGPTINAVLNIDSIGAIITGNNFHECGRAAIENRDQTIVMAAGTRAVVNNNTFFDCRGPQLSVGYKQVLISLFGGYSTAMANIIYQDVSLGTFTTELYIALEFCGDYCNAGHNLFNILGTTAGSPPVVQIYGIADGGAHNSHTIMGNRFTGWTNTGETPGDSKAILLGAGSAHNMVIGNTAEKFDIDASTTGSSTSMVAGNSCLTGTVRPGTNATTGNLSIP